MNKFRKKIIICFCMIITILGTQYVSFAETNENTGKLTDSELNEFFTIFKSVTFNGFLQSEYDKASELNLDIALRECGTEINVSEEEKEEFFKLLGYYFDIPVFKLSTDRIKELYKEATGEDINNIKERLTEWKYIEKYDAYYNAHGDTSYKDVKVISGEKTEDGLYKIIYKSDETVGNKLSEWSLYSKDEKGEIQVKTAKQMIATMKKVNNNYVIISNKIYTQEVEKEENVKKETEQSKQETTADKNNTEDNTIKKSILPKAGKGTAIFVFASIIVAIFMTIKLLKYKDIK